MSVVTEPSTPVAPTMSSSGRGQLYGYALWKYCEQGWVLTKDCSMEGAKVSEPPQEPGLFVGQIRATPSIAA